MLILYLFQPIISNGVRVEVELVWIEPRLYSLSLKKIVENYRCLHTCMVTLALKKVLYSVRI